MTANDIGLPIQLNTGLTGDPDIDYNIPNLASAKLFVAPVTTPPTPPVGYDATINANRISATYDTIGNEFGNGGYFYVQLRIIGPNNSYEYNSPIDRKFINPGFPT